MRRSRTFGYLAGTLGALVAGCAAGEGEPAPDARTADPPPSETRTDETKEGPAFAPKFEAPANGSKVDTSDPSPPGADQCIDADDAGGTENAATVLPETTDCDDAMKPITGISKSAADVDVYKLSAKDKLWCVVETSFEAETPGTEMCVFARCKNAKPNPVSACSAGAPATNDIGMQGCCTAAPGKAIPVVDCGGWSGDDSIDMMVRVRQIQGSKCLPYKINYRF